MHEQPVTIALIGDSTVTDAAGWGKAFAHHCGTHVTVRNFAVGGRSSKSWYDEGRLPAALAARPDYVLVQFGHNDQPGKGPERETDPATTFRHYLALYVEACRAAGAVPVLLSPLTRRTFGADGRIRSTLGPWAAGTRAAAQELDAAFVDLHAASIDYHNHLGPEASVAFNPKEGDRTHLNEQGAAAVAALIVGALQSVAADLATHFSSCACACGTARQKEPRGPGP